MPLPFVSRARYEDVVRERDELRAENKRLLDRLVMNLGARPIYTPLPEEPKAVHLEAEEKKEPGDLPNFRGRPDMNTVKGWAEHAARNGKLPEGVRPVTI
jgi:hypothetical protein